MSRTLVTTEELKRCSKAMRLLQDANHLLSLSENGWEPSDHEKREEIRKFVTEEIQK